jgi:hypothetical protein
MRRSNASMILEDTHNNAKLSRENTISVALLYHSSADMICTLDL